MFVEYCSWLKHVLSVPAIFLVVCLPGCHCITVVPFSCNVLQECYKWQNRVSVYMNYEIYGVVSVHISYCQSSVYNYIHLVVVSTRHFRSGYAFILG